MLNEGFMTATELADYLARRGIPFRTAHEIVGTIVRYCLEKEKTLCDLTLEEFRRFSDKLDMIYLKPLCPEHAVPKEQNEFRSYGIPNVYPAN